MTAQLVETKAPPVVLSLVPNEPDAATETTTSEQLERSAFTYQAWKNLHPVLNYLRVEKERWAEKYRSVALTLAWAEGDTQRILHGDDAPIHFVEPEDHIVLGEG